MKKIAAAVLAATILLVFLRISGFISWNTAKGLVLLCGALLSLYRALWLYLRQRSECTLFLGIAVFAFAFFFSTMNFFTRHQRVLIENFLEVPDEGVRLAWEEFRTEHPKDSDTEWRDALPSSKELRDAFYGVFQEKASETLLDACMGGNELFEYQIRPLEDGYQIEVQELQVEKMDSGNGDTYAYEAVLSVQRPSAPAQESEISGELVYSPYSKFHPKPLVDDLTIRVK